MSSQDSQTDDYAVQQENELEALASIFGEDFHDLRSKDPWKVEACLQCVHHGWWGSLIVMY